MSQDEKNTIIKHLRFRYWRANRRVKGEILTQVCELLGCHRKHANRVMRSFKCENKKPGSKKQYDDPELLNALKAIWMASDQMCSKRLKEVIQLWLPYYESHFGELRQEIKDKLLAISPATIDRVLKKDKVSSRRGLSGTEPGSLLKNQIPIHQGPWDVSMPGFVEADTVAHCGNSLEGSFVWSITLTDIFSTWTEIRATWNKGSKGVLEQIEDIENDLPFKLKGFDCDNGSEFLNYHLLRYFQKRENVVQFTRSRPYHKDDNAHVEQKNWTHVRHLLGYDRLEDPRLVDIINDLYKNEWSLYQNYFCPSMKLVEKTRVNSKYHRKYDKPKTPYQRLMESEHVSDEKKAILKSTYESLDPFALKDAIEQKLKHVFSYVSVTSNVRQRI